MLYLSGAKENKLKNMFILKDMIDSNFLYNIFYLADHEMRQVSDVLNYN